MNKGLIFGDPSAIRMRDDILGDYTRRLAGKVRKQLPHEYPRFSDKDLYVTDTLVVREEADSGEEEILVWRFSSKLWPRRAVILTTNDGDLLYR